MLKVNKYSIQGKKVGDFTLPKEYEGEVSMDLIAQAMRVYEDRSHVGLRNTKTRSEVNRTTKKVYKQKGTGGARHGSRRANVFAGGGVTFGPRPLKRVLTLPKAMREKSKLGAFGLKAKGKELLVVEGLSKVDKTKKTATLIKALSGETKAIRFTFFLSKDNEGVGKFIRNLKNAQNLSYKNANVYNVYKGGMIILDEDIFSAKKQTKVAKKS